MRRMIWIRFLHCFKFAYYKKVFGLTHYSLHTTHYTTILINDINDIIGSLFLCMLIFQIGDYDVQKYELFCCFKWN